MIPVPSVLLLACAILRPSHAYMLARSGHLLQKLKCLH